MSVTVEMISLDSRYVLTGDGKVLPIVQFLDGDDDDCDPYEATVCVAGNDEYGFLTIEIEDYAWGALH